MGRSQPQRPAFVTPEYIAEQRKRKQERLARERLDQAHAKPGPACAMDRPAGTDVILREMAAVSDGSSGSLRLRIMTYNVLAQCNIRREIFVDSGDAVRWTHRSHQLAKEIAHYAPHVMCCQEVDTDKVDTFYGPILAGIGLEYRFHRFPGKRHGVLIAWSNKTFELVECVPVDFDTDPNVPTRVKTQNVAFLVVLRRGTKSLVVATTHLFWHPMGSYERVRQGAILARTAQTLADKHGGCPYVIAGDLNTEPQDPNFASLTRRPLVLTDEEEQILTASERHVYGPNREETGAHALPAAELLKLHEANRPLVSLYGAGYAQVDAENVTQTGHPQFTNWAANFRGHLDYILVEDAQARGKYQFGPFTLRKLLRVPRPDEMKGGEPQPDRFPSDHVCIMAEVDVD